MATSTITGTITGPTGTVVSGAQVVCRLMPLGGFRSADGSEVARAVATTTNGSGVYTLVLERNSGITPANTYYQLTEFIPEAQGGTRVWNISVGASNQTVLASLVTPMAAGVPVYLDQAAADARYQALSAIGTDTPTTIQPDDAAAAGASTAASRGDHKHAIVGAVAGAILPDDAAAEGAATSFARSDHKHSIVAGTPASIGLAGTNSESSGTGFARDLHVHAYSPPACRVYRSTSQAITNAALTALTFDTERYDNDTMHSTVSNTNRITLTTAGLYVVGGHISWQADTDYTRRICYIQVSGAAIIARQSDESPAHALANAEEWSLSTTYKLAANDYIELVVFQTNTSAGANNIVASLAYSPEFYATWVGVG